MVDGQPLTVMTECADSLAASQRYSPPVATDGTSSGMHSRSSSGMAPSCDKEKRGSLGPGTERDKLCEQSPSRRHPVSSHIRYPFPFVILTVLVNVDCIPFVGSERMSPILVTGIEEKN